MSANAGIQSCGQRTGSPLSRGGAEECVCSIQLENAVAAWEPDAGGAPPCRAGTLVPAIGGRKKNGGHKSARLRRRRRKCKKPAAFGHGLTVLFSQKLVRRD
jgi:hypothetical protein